MDTTLYYNTVSPLLKEALHKLMLSGPFSMFRLVGGTALSLHYGHRMSVDIDLFTDAEYGSVDFGLLDETLRGMYPYVAANDYSLVGMGRSYYIGNSDRDAVKLDLFYTDAFIEPVQRVDNIRLASPGEIAAMKLDVIQRTGRKKDFWDIDVLKNQFNIDTMFALHAKRYPYSHDRELLRQKFTDFSGADTDFDPICLQGKHWELIKLDMVELIAALP